MAIAIITPEEVDVDVCFGDFDSSYTKTIYVVDLFNTYVGEPNELETTMYIKNEADAKMLARMWELSMTSRDENGFITFNKIFESAEGMK